MRLLPPARRRHRLLAAASTALLALVVAAPAASAHDGDTHNGLTRDGSVTPGPATQEAKDALAAFEAANAARAAAPGTALAAADDPIVGPGYVSSSNVKYIKTLPLTGDGVGARVVGNRLFITSTKDLQIYDITDPTIPALVGQIALNVEFENEQVPTDGKVLGISGQTPTVNAAGVCPGNVSTGCLAVFDVRGNAPVLITNVPASGDHTATCIEVGGNTCAYTYGSSGSIVDLRTALQPNGAAGVVKLATNWQANLRSRGFPITRGHHQTQIRPGVLITASTPQYVISVRPEDGGGIEAPAVLGRADFQGAPDDKLRFVHSTEWARGGTDRIMLSGGETNFQPTCGPLNGAFSTFLTGGTPNAPTFTFADQVRPKDGNFLDGNPAPGSFKLGCSVHWFEPHPTFNNQGIVALASYENGTKIEKIAPDGKISEVGFFLPLGGSTSAPHWAPDGKTLYLIDYTRGLDIVQYNGPLFLGSGNPAAVVPEAPAAVLLVVSGGLVLLLAGGIARRRRSTGATA